MPNELLHELDLDAGRLDHDAENDFEDELRSRLVNRVMEHYTPCGCGCDKCDCDIRFRKMADTAVDGLVRLLDL